MNSWDCFDCFCLRVIMAWFFFCCSCLVWDRTILFFCISLLIWFDSFFLFFIMVCRVCIFFCRFFILNFFFWSINVSRLLDFFRIWMLDSCLEIWCFRSDFSFFLLFSSFCSFCSLKVMLFSCFFKLEISVVCLVWDFSYFKFCWWRVWIFVFFFFDIV